MIARKVFTGLVIAAAFAVATSPRAAAQDGGARDPQATLDRYEKYLDRKPYADFAFDKLVEAAVQQNQLKELVGHYEERLAEGPDDRAAQVVLGRLYARTDQFAEALAVLEGIEEPDAELYALLGQLHLRGNDPAAATEALERAAAATTDRKLLADIHRRRGEAFLAAGDREAAARAFRDTAELEPESFNARLEVASLMAQHGLHEEAVQQFQVAEELASGDVPRRCQVLSEIGRLHEQRLQIPEALEVYRRAMELMGRGNWLKRDLTERIISIHRRSGTLDELVARARADAEGSPQDLDAREFLARALREAGNEEEARGVLAAAVADFPDDLKLSRGLIAVLEELEDTEAVIAEYQRVLTRRPEELELYLELGRVFAREGRWEQAKLQWQRTLEQRVVQVGGVGAAAPGGDAAQQVPTQVESGHPRVDPQCLAEGGGIGRADAVVAQVELGQRGVGLEGPSDGDRRVILEVVPGNVQGGHPRGDREQAGNDHALGHPEVLAAQVELGELVGLQLGHGHL